MHYLKGREEVSKTIISVNDRMRLQKLSKALGGFQFPLCIGVSHSLLMGASQSTPISVEKDQNVCFCIGSRLCMEDLQSTPILSVGKKSIKCIYTYVCTQPLGLNTYLGASYTHT